MPPQIKSLVPCLLLLVCSLSSAQDLGFLDDISTAITGDTYYFFGDDLRLSCSLKDDLWEDGFKNFTAYNISFRLIDLTGLVLQCIPMRYVHVEDSTLARLIIPNITMEYVGYYKCEVGPFPCSNDSDWILVGLSNQSVKVEYAPQNVTNFQCLVYNWDEYMMCTWEHPVDYINWSNLNVFTVYAVKQGTSTPWTNSCPKPTKTSCTWNQETTSFLAPFVIEVTVTNTIKNVKASEVFVQYPNKSVKPHPVDRLSINKSKEMTDCLFLSYHHSREKKNKTYRIQYRLHGEKNFTVLNDSIRDSNYSACGLAPYTVYDFSVEVFPEDPYSGYWSDPLFANETTLMTAPKSGPQVTDGSFWSTTCVKENRNVMLMWKEVDLTAQNGIIDSYLIKVGDTNLSCVNGRALSATVVLPCFTSSEVKIYAHNEGNYSLHPSVLLISTVNFTVPTKIQETFSVAIMPGQNSRAVWEEDKAAKDLNYTLFWCEGLLGSEMKCSGLINWAVVPEEQRFFDFPVTSSEAVKYLYGISGTNVNSGKSTGIYWTKCLFKSTKLLQEHVENMKVIEGIEQAQVSWDRIECNYQSLIKVTHYIIKFCETTKCNDTDKVHSIKVPEKENFYTLLHLTASVSYSVTVQPEFNDTFGDEFEPWIQAVPKKPNSNKEVLAITLSVIVSIVAIVLVVSFFCYRKCVKRKKKVLAFFPSSMFPSEERIGVPPRLPTRPLDHIEMRLLSNSSVRSSESGSEVHSSPQNSTVGNNMPGHVQTGRTVQGETSSNTESAHSYQLFRPSPYNQSSKAHDGYQQDEGTGLVLSSSNCGTTQSYYLSKKPSSNQSLEKSDSSQQSGCTSMESAFSSCESHQNVASTPSGIPGAQTHLLPQDEVVYHLNEIIISPTYQEHSEKVIEYSEKTTPKEILAAGNRALVTIATPHMPNQITSSADDNVSEIPTSGTNSRQPLMGVDNCMDEKATETLDMAKEDLEKTRSQEILAPGNPELVTVATPDILKQIFYSEMPAADANSSQKLSDVHTDGVSELPLRVCADLEQTQPHKILKSGDLELTIETSNLSNMSFNSSANSLHEIIDSDNSQPNHSPSDPQNPDCSDKNSNGYC